jgi:hypothetical protein
VKERKEVGEETARGFDKEIWRKSENEKCDTFFGGSGEDKR